MVHRREMARKNMSSSHEFPTNRSRILQYYDFAEPAQIRIATEFQIAPSVAPEKADFLRNVLIPTVVRWFERVLDVRRPVVGNLGIPRHKRGGESGEEEDGGRNRPEQGVAGGGAAGVARTMRRRRRRREEREWQEEREREEEDDEEEEVRKRIKRRKWRMRRRRMEGREDSSKQQRRSGTRRRGSGR
ncbi:hypothetical protein CBR_g37157 [Chara braunii]|uniref:Uncharacterized protein n=1 Tax=Chara braunii TaxID=69332 RepID=A0A388LMJ4_CHABU|nr:hypothetical protein CBR_g37157 [Chara braunii]|eukprot:GBG83445.1 hypothetical protein CBR_g37157 [Chara braunii]